MLLKRLMVTSFLVAPLYFALASTPAMANCTGSIINDIPDEGSTLTCGTGQLANQIGVTGNDATSFTVNVTDNAALTLQAASPSVMFAGESVTINTINGANLQGSVASTDATLYVNAGDTNVFQSQGTTFNSGLNSEYELGDNNKITSTQGKAIVSHGNLSILAGDGLSINAHTTGIEINSGLANIGGGENTIIHGGAHAALAVDASVNNALLLDLGEGSVVSSVSDVAIQGFSTVAIAQGVSTYSQNATAIVTTALDDVVSIGGRVRGGNGKAIELLAGDDVVNLQTGADIEGIIDGGTGTNTVKMMGTGTLTQAAILQNIQNFSLEGNISLYPETNWTVLGDRSFSNDVSVSAGTLKVDNKISAGNDITLASDSVLNLNIATGTLLAGNQATITGASLGFYTANDTYSRQARTIIEAQNGVTGEFSNVAYTGNFLKPNIQYAQNAVYLSFDATALNTPERAKNAPARQVAQSLDTFFKNNQTGLENLQTALNTMDDAQMSDLLASQIGQIGELAALSVAGAARSNTQVVLNRTGAHSGIAAGDESMPLTFWMQGTGNEGRVRGKGQAFGSKYSGGGGVAGVEYRSLNSDLYGLFGGYSQTDGRYTDTNLKDKNKTGVYQVGVYAGQNYGPIELTGVLSAAYLDFETHRPTVLGNAHATFKGAGAFADVGVAYNLRVGDDIVIAPNVSLEANYIHQKSYREKGAGNLNLDVASSSSKSLVSVLGVRAQKTWVTQINSLTGSIELGWAHEYLDRNGKSQVSMVGAPTVAYTSSGVARDRDSARIGVSFVMAGAKGDKTGVSGYVSYNGDFSGNAHDQAISVGIRYRW